MAVLAVLLEQSLAAGDRLVVVSQSTAALDLVQVRLAWAAGGGQLGSGLRAAVLPVPARLDL